MRCTGMFRPPTGGGDALQIVQRGAAVRVSGMCKCERVRARLVCHQATHAGHCEAGETDREGSETVSILVRAREVQVGRWAVRGGREGVGERADKTERGGRGGDADKNEHTHTHTQGERDMH